LAAVLFVSSIGIIYSVVKGGVLGRWRAERLQDLRLQADAVFAFDAAKDLVPFYQAFPQPEFTVLMNKFVVNLKPESAHPTAMGFFHLFFNCDSQDTAVELKDREQEVSDFVQRIVERFTYSEVNSRIGEERMKDTIREEVNRLLNQGRVKNVYLNYKITKP
jgi:flagellar basal body-associated protein FliL